MDYSRSRYREYSRDSHTAPVAATAHSTLIMLLFFLTTCLLLSSQNVQGGRRNLSHEKRSHVGTAQRFTAEAHLYDADSDISTAGPVPPDANIHTDEGYGECV